MAFRARKVIGTFEKRGTGFLNSRGNLGNDDGDGNKNVISKYKFALLLSFRDYFNLLILQGCGSSSRMTLVGTVFNVGEKMKIYPQVLKFFKKPQIWLFHVVVLLTTAKKWTKVKKARAGRAKLLFLPGKYANL